VILAPFHWSKMTLSRRALVIIRGFSISTYSTPGTLKLLQAMPFLLMELGGKALRVAIVIGVIFSGELFYPYAPFAVLD